MLAVVRYQQVIGHRANDESVGCPMLAGYRTTRLQRDNGLSDSSDISDIGSVLGDEVVRF